MLFSVNSVPLGLQDSDDEGNDDNVEESASLKKEFSSRSPSPPADDSEPEMTEEEKEFQLVSTAFKVITEEGLLQCVYPI